LEELLISLSLPGSGVLHNMVECLAIKGEQHAVSLRHDRRCARSVVKECELAKGIAGCIADDLLPELLELFHLDIAVEDAGLYHKEMVPIVALPNDIVPGFKLLDLHGIYHDVLLLLVDRGEHERLAQDLLYLCALLRRLRDHNGLVLDLFVEYSVTLRTNRCPPGFVSRLLLQFLLL